MKINWEHVRQAQKRGKQGRMLPGDQELCEQAWKLDPDRYKEQAQEVREECTAEINPFADRKE